MCDDRRPPLGDVAVLGLGRTGESACRYLAALGPSRVRSITLIGGAASRPGETTRALEELGVQVVLGTDELTGSYDLVVASPGIPLGSDFAQSARAHAHEFIGEPELAWRESPERWIAITGTNGKTTTTSLTTHLLHGAGLEARAVGNIGLPPTAAIAGRPDGGWLVAELSSFQLAETSRLHPRISVLLNVTPDHLEWHGTMEAYAAAKERAFANLTSGDLVVISVDDAWCRAAAERAEQRGIPVCRLSVEHEPAGACAAFLRNEQLVVRLHGVEHELVGTGELQILGRHNAQNALAASAAALGAGAPDEAVREGLRSFEPMEHRFEPAGTVGGVRFVNDSKATNPDAVVQALKAFRPGEAVVLLGGHDKGVKLDELAGAVRARCRVAVCFGEAGERIARALTVEPSELTVLRAAGLREAFATAVDAARPGETVLLSPACSSFDEFSNMAERGRCFKELVRALAAEEA